MMKESLEITGAFGLAQTHQRAIKIIDLSIGEPRLSLFPKTILDDFGFERDIADNGKIAIEKLKTNNYDVVLMDLQMPEMNGFEATEYIRKTMNSKIPIIALTADVTTADLAKCKAVGMNDYLAKPVNEKLLYSKIVSILKKPKLTKLSAKLNENSEEKDNTKKKIRCIDLVYLNQKTKSNPNQHVESAGNGGSNPALKFDDVG